LKAGWGENEFGNAEHGWQQEICWPEKKKVCWAK